MYLIADLPKSTLYIISISFLIMTLSSCFPSPQTSTKLDTGTPPTTSVPTPTNSLPPADPDPTLPEREDYPWGATARAALMTTKPFVYYWGHPPLVNCEYTQFYGGLFPRTTILADYVGKRFMGVMMAVRLDSPFEKNLPKEIFEELKKRNLLNNKSIDIAWVIQSLADLGGNQEGNIKNITYLKAHGWADPTSKGAGVGPGVNRNFLYGIFDADVDISHEVPLGTMKPFNLHTHDGAVSPKTAALRLPNAAPDSMAFWSLVIDSENPTGKIRALATLHWLISGKDQENFKRESFVTATITDHRGEEVPDTKWSVPFDDLLGYTTMLQTTSSFKDSSLVKKLTALIKP